MCESPPLDNPEGQSAGCGCDRADRRRFLCMGLAALAGGNLFANGLVGCATASSQGVARAMPGPVWPPELPPGSLDPPPASVSSRPPAGREPPPIANVIARSRWTSAQPYLPIINRMGPIHSITVHHDGMRPYFEERGEAASVARLESIRRAHRERQGWGDIGYHYAIDRSGRIFECRSIAYQGAHVKNHNEGNVGVLVMGNFDEQSPTDAQLGAITDHVSRLMRQYRVAASRVRTHREWETAVTACPGRVLQHHMDVLRSRRMLG